MRSLFQPFFAGHRLYALREGTRELICGLLDEMADQPEHDFAQAAALQIPVNVFSTLLDVPEADRNRMFNLSARALIPAEVAGTDGRTAQEIQEEAFAQLRQYVLETTAAASRRTTC